MQITDKDWGRMSDLILSRRDSDKIAKSIKNKDKAISRFIAGLKLEGEIIKYKESWKEFLGHFSEFGNRALELGATLEEIQMAFDENEIPSKYSEKLLSLGNKKLASRFVGFLSKAILDADMDINFLPHNGNAITREGRDAMSRNGRKWTIGYKAEITSGSKKMILVFDAITDEGDGPTSYIVSESDSHQLFDDITSWVPIGKLKFVSNVMSSLKSV